MLKPKDGRNGEGQDHDVGENVHDGVGDPKLVRVDAPRIDRLVPGSGDGDALPNRGRHATYAPGHDDGHDGEGGQPEARGHKYAQVQEDGSHLVEADADLVGRLGKEEELQGGAEVRRR